MKTLLLIGGSRAGQSITVNHDLVELRMPARLEFGAVTADVVTGSHTMRQEIYLVRFVSIGNRSVEVFCLAGLNPTEELLRGYHPVITEKF